LGKNKLYLGIIIILFISIVSTITLASVNINTVEGTSGVEISLPKTITTNYSTINVNNSYYFQGYTPTTLGNWLQTTFGWVNNFINAESLTVNYTVADASTLYLMTTNNTGGVEGAYFQYDGYALEIGEAASHNAIILISGIPAASGHPTLSIDTANSFVGINTTSPSANLYVEGNGSTSAVFTNGNVGIGTIFPQQKLTVVGDLNVTSNSTFLELSGTGNAYICVDSSGRIYRSVDPCV